MKIKISGIKNILRKRKSLTKIPTILAKHFLLTCLFLLLFSLILGGILSYKYIILTKKVEPQVFSKSSLLDEKIYEEVLKAWRQAAERFNETDLKEYPDSFKQPS